MKKYVLSAMFALVALLGGTGGSTQAQVSSEYQIVVPKASLDRPLTLPGISTFGAGLKSLTAKVGSATCTTAVTAGATSDVILRIGLPGQPEACSEEGAIVWLINGDGRRLSQTFTLHKGTRDALANFVPVPPGTPQEPKPNPLGPMQVVIPASIMAEPVSGKPDEDTIGEFLGGTVSAYADSVFCGSVEVSNISVDAVLLVGLDTQSPVCSRAGVDLTFTANVGPDEYPIGPKWKVEPGARRMLTMFGGPAIADYFPVPAPIDTGPLLSPPLSRSIVPPAAGDGGLVP